MGQRVIGLMGGWVSRNLNILRIEKMVHKNGHSHILVHVIVALILEKRKFVVFKLYFACTSLGIPFFSRLICQ